MLTKKCNNCCEVKPVEDFWKRGGRWPGRIHLCKVCKSADQKAKRQANPERERERNRQRYWSNRNAERERHLLKKYGITLATYAEMLAAQQGACAVCGRPEPANKTLDVDHDHATGQVRGLLCTSCNRMIGHAHDSIKRLVAAARYLQLSRRSRRSSSGRTAQRKGASDA